MGIWFSAERENVQADLIPIPSKIPTYLAPKKRLSLSELDWSPTVANNAMNRERNASGPNSYAQDLGMNPIDFLEKRADLPNVSWVDLCCGEGRALIEAATWLKGHPGPQNIQLEGVDLVPYFAPVPQGIDVQFSVNSLRKWEPRGPYDLITIVHGLHYVGDKLGMVQKCLRQLKPDGLFIAHLDWAHVLVNEKPVSHSIRQAWGKQGLAYDGRRKLLTAKGPVELDIPFKYIGADDEIGPNFSGQNGVGSYYAYT